MLIDFENTGFITVSPTPDLIPVADKNTYIPTNTWGYIKGSISEQSDLMSLLANIESGLTHDQIALLTNADIRLNGVEQDIIDLTAKHNTEFTDITTALSTKADAADYYTKSEIDSKKYLTEHQSLAGYATENWVYGRGYISAETDPVWSAEKHKYALKSELPSTAGFATTNWVNEQLTAKANVSDIYSKIEIDSKKYITESQLNTELLAKANLSDIYTKIEIDGKNFATKDWAATELLAYAKLGDVYTKTEMDDKEFITSDYLNEQLLTKTNTGDVYTKIEIDNKEFITAPYLEEELTAKANLTDVYTKIEIDGKNFATQDWTAEKLLTKANASDVWTKTEIAGGMLDADTFKITGYATENWVKEQNYLTEHQSLDNYYTKNEVDTAIENVEVDLTGYATESWVKEQNYLTEHQSLADYYTKEEVDAAISNTEVKIAGYGYITENWIDSQGFLTSVDLTGYATESYVNMEVNSKVDYSKIWTGTQEEWDALDSDEQNSYIIAMIEL